VQDLSCTKLGGFLFMNLLLENFRCFAGKHTINITPLTFLVGENSAGKSTFLAALSVISDFSTYPGKPRFETPPYNLGGYNTIATYSKNKNGIAKTILKKKSCCLNYYNPSCKFIV
jgi:predicted ATPase